MIEYRVTTIIVEKKRGLNGAGSLGYAVGLSLLTRYEERRSIRSRRSRKR